MKGQGGREKGEGDDPGGKVSGKLIKRRGRGGPKILRWLGKSGGSKC